MNTKFRIVVIPKEREREREKRDWSEVYRRGGGYQCIYNALSQTRLWVQESHIISTVYMSEMPCN